MHTPPLENYEARLQKLIEDCVAAQSALLCESDDYPKAVAVESIRYQIADTKAAIEEIRLGIA